MKSSTTLRDMSVLDTLAGISLALPSYACVAGKDARVHLLRQNNMIVDRCVDQTTEPLVLDRPRMSRPDAPP